MVQVFINYSHVFFFRRPLILGIETSCDDTGCALVDGAGTIHGESSYSQEKIHLK